MAEGTNSGTHAGWMGCNVDFGNDDALELDYRRPDAPWLSINAGIAAADVWFKGSEGLPDVRFRIERIRGGIKVEVDRGEQSEKWWPKEAPPRLKVTFDGSRVTASASVGMGDEFQEVDLGTTAF